MVTSETKFARDAPFVMNKHGEVFLNEVSAWKRSKVEIFSRFSSCKKIEVMASSVIPSRKDVHTWERVLKTSRCNGEIDL